MAENTTIDKKYLDLEGIKYLKNNKILVKHPTKTASSASAVKVGTDADGHVIIGDALKYSDLSGLPSIGNGKLTLKIGDTKI